MACPLVAGAIALMKSYNPNLSNEQVFAKLIQPVKINLMQAGVMDIQKSTFTDPPAELYYVSHSIADSLYGGDDDGKPDAVLAKLMAKRGQPMNKNVATRATKHNSQVALGGANRVI
jgi:subtilisin family serine protease